MENQRLEYKSAYTDDMDLEKEVVAFLNSKEGSIIYFGIDDSGKILGIKQRDKIILKIKSRNAFKNIPLSFKQTKTLKTKTSKKWKI